MRSRNRKEKRTLSLRFGSRRQKKGSRGKRSSIKDSLVTKPSKKYPLVLWMAILGLIMISGVYIFSLCLKLRVFVVTPNQLKGKATKQTCHDPHIPQSELRYMHYPEPTTYSSSVLCYSIDAEVWEWMAPWKPGCDITWFSFDLTGLMQHHKDIIEYFNKKGVSAILLFRRNLLCRLVSVLANSHDRNAKQLNGTHKAHVHSKNEADVLARYKPTINTTLLIPELKHTDKWGADAMEHFKSTRHILLYYEDLVDNSTKLMDVLDFLRLPQQMLSSRHVKIHSKPLSDQIENWDAVYTALKGTEYESFLNADYQI
ncbi:hypothetical protein C4D60_Mb02t14920 [Musa balbisiana]|uniref:Sulfotransferase n=1 Tax=Musa balbisiana TaxID=52838 RepID=A0A4S8IAS3_MUSBA|nr:hypothetical protein C4D60_Mb02t14920 [Musa balbisiana]